MTDSLAGAASKPTVAILAAGEGRRLWRNGDRVSKLGTALQQSSLGEWSLRGFTGAGLSRFLIILGSYGAAVRELYETVAHRLGCDVSFVETEDWQRGNGVSALAAARSLHAAPFILSMADHLFSPGFVGEVVRHAPAPGEVSLAVDQDIAPEVDLEDLTKVRIEGEKITAIGKELHPWDAGDTGLFYCTDGLRKGLEQAQARGLYSLSDGVRECASKGLVRALRIGPEHSWMDVDTPSDLAEAERRGFPWFADRIATPV
jgi:choline kinase